MSDMRVILAVILIFLLGFGLLLAKAFVFAVSWIFWPVSIIAVVGGIFLFLMSGWSA